MKWLVSQAWQYAVLLILLFMIAALAVGGTIAHLDDWGVPAQGQRVLAVVLWSITLGFMLMAGAFGILLIQTSAAAAARRRVSAFVDAMDYLRDGVLIVDRRGVITGCNPVARALSGGALAAGQGLAEAFPALRNEDVDVLARSREPGEVERRVATNRGLRDLRFRSQPSEGLTAVLISDVTDLNAQASRSRQIARLDLLSQVARGLANDLNRLLCSMSGYASVLVRVPGDSADAKQAAWALERNAEKGVVLAGRLRDLVRPMSPSPRTGLVREAIEAAGDALRDGLPREWTVQVRAEALPPVALSAAQIEQLVTNAGYVVADASPSPGLLLIEAGVDRDAAPARGGVSSVILIRAEREAGAADTASSAPAPADTAAERGVIESVVATVVEEAGGRLVRTVGADGSLELRLALPPAPVVPAGEDLRDEVAAGLREYLASWRVLLGARGGHRDALLARLEGLGVSVEPVSDLVSVLTRVQEERYDALVIDKTMLRREADALLRAVARLSGHAGIVILSEDPAAEPPDLQTGVVFVSRDSGPDRMAVALTEAKGLSLGRSRT